MSLVFLVLLGLAFSPTTPSPGTRGSLAPDRLVAATPNCLTPYCSDHAPPTVPGARPSTGLMALQSLERRLNALAGTPGAPRLGFHDVLGIQPNETPGVPLYPAAPAPVGIGDFGILNSTGVPVRTVFDSPSWAGTITLNSGSVFYPPVAAPDNFTVQLNAYATNVTVYHNSSYVYWIQNAFSYSPSEQTLWILSDLYNFSAGLNASTLPLQPSAFFSDNGSIFEYSVYTSFGPTIHITYPFTAHLYLNNSLTERNGISYPTVRLGYDVTKNGRTIRAGVYDTILFNSTNPAGPSVPLPVYQVNAKSLLEDFIPEDAEFVVAGAGEGSPAVAENFNASMQLVYYNETMAAYENAPSAWDVGSSTGEVAAGISAHSGSPGTMDLTTGPMYVLPMWNATPGGNEGATTFRGKLAPDNAFLFLMRGGPFNPQAPTSWAPTVPGGSFLFVLPPATNYSGEALLSNHDPGIFNFTARNGSTSWRNFSLARDDAQGIYTPLFAWNNDQLANLSTSGKGTALDPYLLPNTQTQPISPLFGDIGLGGWDMFPGVQLVDTSDYAILEDPPPFFIVFPEYLDPVLADESLPASNQLQIVFADSAHLSLWGGQQVGGWRGLETMDGSGDVILWNTTDSLVGDNDFVVQGTGLVLDGGGHNNTVWGNRFVNGILTAGMQFYNIGIFEDNGGDLLYNNYLATTEGAVAPGINIWQWTSFSVIQPIDNRDQWNLSAAEPATTVASVNGFNLTGSVTGGATVCGNWWSEYRPNMTLPYTDSGWSGYSFASPLPEYYSLIAQGGDFCPSGPSGGVVYPVTFTESGLSSGTWQVTFVGQVESAAAGDSISFPILNGSWAYFVGSEVGYTVSPASGSIEVDGHAVTVAIQIASTAGTWSSELFEIAAISLFAVAALLVLAVIFFPRPPTRNPDPRTPPLGSSHIEGEPPAASPDPASAGGAPPGETRGT
jgi:thermopsin